LLGWLVLAHAGLRIASYATVRTWIARVPRRRRIATAINISECERALDRVSRALPFTNCLSRAMATACLLRRDGVPSTLTLGVGFDPARRFEAHAWLDVNGRTVCGAFEASRHQALLRDPICFQQP
jgi:hypothetical protein